MSVMEMQPASPWLGLFRRRDGARRGFRSGLRPGVEVLEAISLLNATPTPITLPPVSVNFPLQLIDGMVRTATLPQFNPALGTLISVTVTASATMTGQVTAENLSETQVPPPSNTVTATLDGAFDIHAADIAFSLTGSKTPPPKVVAPFDGAQDFMGPDTVFFSPLELNLQKSASETRTNTTSNLAAFIGTGTLPVTFNPTGMATASEVAGNLATMAETRASADVTIQYTYIPAPTCVSVNTIVRGIHNQPTQIQLSFDAALNPTEANNPANYKIVAPGRDFKFGTADDRTIPIKSVTYDDTTHTVTIIPAVPLGVGRAYAYQLTVNGPAIVNPPADGLLNLDGQCGVYTTIIQRGTHLHYTDVDGDRVTLGISHGGVLELLRAPNGEARQLYILNGSQYGQRLSPNHSFLQGSVTRRHGGDGQATISQIIGANQVQIRLKQPPFRIGALVNPTTPLPNMALPGSGILPLAARLRKHR